MSKHFCVRTVVAAVIMISVSLVDLGTGLSESGSIAAADWPMLGRDGTRNPVSPEKGAPTGWDVKTGKNVKWSARLGTQTYAAPIIAGGQVYVGTNNAAGYLERYPKEVDLGCLLCFRESDGEFLWQYSAEKLPTGRVHDWPYQGLGSSPLVEGERTWFVSNRWEVICADTQGFRDGENDGPYVDEPGTGPREADVLWKLDLIGELGVFPHPAGMGPDRRCSIAASYKNRIYVVTGNGVDPSHINIPAPDAPSLVCLEKKTGKILWSDNSPGKNILHTQIASPLVAEIKGQAQVIVPQGDGWIRSFDALSGELIWKFDVNFKESKWTLGGRGSRNNILAAPVLHENRVYVASGQEVEHGEGMGRLVCIDPTKKGDVSSELAVDQDGNVLPQRRLQAIDRSKGESAIPNPNSGVIWEFGVKTLEEYKKQEFEDQMHRTISSVAVHDGLVIVGDFPGLVHCLDAKTGEQHWTYDAFASIFAAPLIVDNTVYVADEDGEVAVFRLSADPDVAMKKVDGGYRPIAEIYIESSVYCSPTFANGTLYIANRSMLYAIAEEKAPPGKPKDKKTSSYWPQWRGPNRDNVSTETGLLKQWPEGGPPLVWRAERLGDGIGPVSVANGRIYAISRFDDQEYVVALGEETGAHLWTTYLGRTLNQGVLMQWLTQRAPTLDVDHLYAVSALGDLACLRTRDGDRVWHRKYIENLYGQRGPWGFGDRPLVDGELLIVVPGGEVASVTALDKHTGRVRWTHAVNGEGWGVYSTGIVAEIGDVRQFITSFGNTAVGLRVNDGRRLWQADVNPRRQHNPFTPIVRDRNVLFPLGFGREVVRFQIVPGKERFEARRRYTVQAALDAFHDSTLLLGDHLYLFGPIASCYDWETGETKWQRRIGRRSAAIYADGHVYLRDTEGLVRLLHVTPEGFSEHGSFTIPDRQVQRGATFPVIAGGKLYLRDNDRLFCYDVREDALQKPRVEPKRVVLPKLADAVVRRPRPQGPASDVRRVPKSAFVPTPHDVVEKMFELAAVKKSDAVYDLGSGDGRILIAAAKKYGCKTVGYEIDPELVKLSREEAREAKVETLVSIHQADLFTADLSNADVVTLYLLPIQTEKLIPQLKHLRPGSRIVAHEFPIPGFATDKTITMESKESGEKHTLYLWTTPLKASKSRASASVPRVFPAGELPGDERLGPLLGERGDFSFTPATSPAEWKERRAKVRRIMRVTMGLWPMPSKTPLNAVVHGRIDRGDYTVEKVYLESLPGFFVTGNLYRPKVKIPGISEDPRNLSRPGVLSPHGHFPGGRFQDAGEEEVRRLIAAGAERFLEGGRSFMQSRCVQLARMGCVVFHYDMIGYADAGQIPLDVAHRFSRLRVKFTEPPAAGLYSAKAELRLENPLGLHTYNSIRALDFLTNLPDVDPKRIAVTGGSGGGTQTFMLCAVDNRPLVSVPVVIVSTTRQGGCTCENIPGLRIGTYNLEFTALHAPKPLLLISADDATRTMPERGFPQLRRHYRALGAEENAAHVALLQFPHNYNAVSRTAMYHWLNKHLKLGLDEPILERPYQRLTTAEMTVWDEQHPRPPQPTGRDPWARQKVLDWLSRDSDRQMAALAPRDEDSLQRYREVVGGAWDVLLRRPPADAGAAFAARRSVDRGTYTESHGLLRYRTVDGRRAELPLIRLVPTRPGQKKARRTVVWIDKAGKSALFADDELAAPPVRTLLDAGVSVIGVDLLYQGEFLSDGKSLTRQRWLDGEQAFAGWTYCYNLPLFAQRVNDILAVVAWARRRVTQSVPETSDHSDSGPNGALRDTAERDAETAREVDVVGLSGAGHWVAAAIAQAHGGIARAVVDTGGFRFRELTDVYGVDFLPGGVKYGDLPGLLALSAPTPLWLSGEGSEAAPIAAAYRAAGKLDNLTIFTGPQRDAARTAAAVKWLLAD